MIPKECEKCIHCRVCAYNNPKRKPHCGFYEESRQTGEWICKDKVDGHMFGYSCSNCRNPEWKITNYCPNCGAKMKGGAE